MKKINTLVFLLLNFALFQSAKSTIITGSNYGGANLTPSNGDTLSGVFTNVGTFYIQSGYTVYVNPGVSLSVSAVTITIDGTLNGNGAGYGGGAIVSTISNGNSGLGSGGGEGGFLGNCVHGTGGGGGAYGGNGGHSSRAGGVLTTPANPAAGGTAYGNNNILSSIFMGSGGGSGAGYCVKYGSGYDGAGGNGGAAIELISSGSTDISGSILANGTDGAFNPSGGAGGGGAGGGININAAIGSVTGTLSANGGNGGNANTAGIGQSGGGGGGGRIKLSSNVCIVNATITVNFGNGGTGAQFTPSPDSENGYIGTMYGGSNSCGKTLDFDGTNDLVSLGNPTALGFSKSSPLTIEAWIKATSGATADEQIVSKIDNTFKGYGLQIGNINGRNGKIEFYLIGNYGANNALWIRSNYATDIKDNNWHHIAATYDGSNTLNNMHIYIDGVDYGSTSVSTSSISADITNTANCNIGSYDASGSPNEYFLGKLDDIRIWGVSRTCAEIKSTMNHELVGNETNLVAYYQFNQGVPNANNSGITTLNDLTANALNGTLNNFALTGLTSNWAAPGSGISGTTPDPQPEINVTGNAVTIVDGDITPSPSDFTDFGTVTSLVRTFTIENTGTGTLNISSIVSSGANASDFVVGSIPTSVSAMSSANFTVTFTAGAYGMARNATITVNSDDCDESTYDFAVTAFGLNPGIPPVGSGIAYSLRKIDETYNGPAIQVRRTCDNAVKDIGFDDCGDLDTNALKSFVYGAPALGALGTSAQAAFSLRNLGCGYAGAAIQVRRSSDNTTKDIGFTSTGDLDTASLLTFVGSNSGYVTIWYDQSGNGRNATQATANNQPRIVNAGVVERQNGKPALRFLTVNSGLATASFTAFNSAATFNGVAKVNSNLTYNAIVSKTGSGGNANIPAPIDFYNKRHVVGNGTSYAFYDVTNDFVASKPLSIWTFQAQSGGTFDAYYNGAANGTAAVGSTFSDVGNPLYIGKRADGVTGLNGWISEILTFASFPSTADRQYFEYTQALYYGISGPSYAAPSTPPSGYVAKWYDQSGNASDASQATASAQPRIMNAGVIERIAGRPTMVFSGAQTLLSSSNPNLLTTAGDKTTLSAVFQNANNIASCLVSNGEATTNRYLIHASWSDNQTYFDIGSWNSGGRLNGALTWTSPAIGTFIRNGAKGNVYQNGTSILSSSSLSTAVSSTNNIWIGSFNGVSTFMQGAVSELVAYPNALNTVRKTILENNQSQYYGIGISNDKYSPVDANYLRNMDGIGFEASNDSAQRTIRNDGFEMEDLAPGATNFLKDAGDYMLVGRSCAVAPATTTANINLAQGIVQRWITDWEVKKSDVNSNGGNVKFIFDFDAYWNDNIAPGVTNNYVLLYRSSSSGTFDTLAVVSKAVVGHKVIFVVNSSNINTFFTIGTVDQGASPLPVSLINFHCKKDNLTQATLSWNTVSETDNDYFTIEKSTDGKQYQYLARIKGAGNSSELRKYQYTDRDLQMGNTYYRIKQTDFNGTTEIKDQCVVMNLASPESGVVTLYPNPANNTIHVQDDRDGSKTITVFNNLGQVVVEIANNEESNMEINCSGLSEGIYMIQVRYTDGFVANKKFLIQR